MLKAKTIRSTYGKPWAKLVGETNVDKNFLNGVGKILLKRVVREAHRDLILQGKRRTPYGEKEGLPVDQKFFSSFGYRIKGRSTIEITSTWPWIDQILEGRNKFRMYWLTRDRGIGIVPLEPEPGTVIFRWAPENKQKAWWHPGFKKHNFVNRALKKSKREIDKFAAEYLLAKMSKTKKIRL